ncbi:MAG: tandem-95 repeat protein, partial [bacterium]|nr:tandem-95 repeat protein [bacterium]
PTAANDSASVNEGASVVINLSGNDTDPDNALDLSSIVITSAPANGTLVDNGDGTLTYTHDGSETVGDSFSYTIDDVSGATSNVASVTVTVNPQNDAPTAANDSASVNEGASVVINLSGNDTDPDNALDLSSIVITSAPANGTLVDNGDGTLTYTHDGSETVGDSFSYTIDDASGATSNVASVTVTVNPQNDAPTAANDSASVNEGASVTINLTGNDTDPDNALDLSSIVITSGPANGTLVDNGDGTLTYSHDGSETVGDSFSYTIDDTSGATSNVASVTLTVNPVNDAPLINDQVMSVDENSAVGTNLGTVAATDPDLGDSLAYAVTGGNLGGAFAIDPATGELFVADSAPLDFETNPSIALTVEVEDLSGERRSAIVTVNVLNVNEAVTVSGPAGLSMDLSESLVFSSVKGTAIAIGDPDGPATPLEVTLSAGGGTLSLAATGGLTMLVGDGLNDAAMTFRGSVADVTTALDGMSFDPSGTGTATIGVSVADLAAGGTSASTSLGVTVGAAPTPMPVEPPASPTSTPTPSSLPPTPTENPPAPTNPGALPTPTPASPAPIAEQVTPVLAVPPAPLEVEAWEPRWDQTEFTAGDFAHALLVGDTQQQPEPVDREARPQVDLLRASFVHTDFFQSLDQMRRDVLSDAEETGSADRDWLVLAIEGIAMAATTGLLAGVLRASSLLAMAISTVPLWRRADPLMILSLSNEERRDLEATLRRAATNEQDLNAVLDGQAASQEAKGEEAAEDD